MIRYGAILPTDESGEITFFRTSREIPAGAYEAPAVGSARVEIAESSAALLMAIYPRIAEMQRRAQEDLRSPGLSEAAVDRLADQMTDDLARRLAEDDAIWEDEPPWLEHLRPLGETN